MEDDQIVDLYWARSEAAIAETEKKYGRYCRYIAFRILQNDEDAKEIVNDTYLKTWNTIPPNRPDQLKPYVGTVFHKMGREGMTKGMRGYLLADRCQTSHLLHCLEH